MKKKHFKLFTYKIHDKNLDILEKVIAVSSEAAVATLKTPGSTNNVISVPNKFLDEVLFKFQIIKINYTSDFLLFCQKMHKCLLSGASLKDALILCSTATLNPFLKGILGDLMLKISKRGLLLSEALEYYQEYFSEYSLALIKASEACGRLGWAFGELACDLEQQSTIQKKVKAGLFYPTILLFLSIFSVMIISIVALPKIVENFKNFNTKIPPFTAYFIATLSFLKTKGWIFLLGIQIGGFGFLKIKKISLKSLFFNMLDKIPFLKNITISVKLAKCLKTISTLMESGIHVDVIYQHAQQITYNRTLKDYFFAIHQKIKKGASPEEAFYYESYRLKKIGKIISTELQIAKFCGDPEKILSHIAEAMYEEAVNKAESMTKLIEPLMLIPISCFIGFLMLIVYLPTFDLMLSILNN